MNVNGLPQRSIWLKKDDPTIVQIIDQTKLPHCFEVMNLSSFEDVFVAIKDMHVRGAPLIGVTAAFGIYLASLKLKEENCNNKLYKVAEYLKSARPTAINLEWAINEQLKEVLKEKTVKEKIKTALKTVNHLLERDIESCKMIGLYGLELIKEISIKKRGTINILTHCNAGWLACIDYGTATSPIYQAFDLGIDIHVWVDETRPRNQGSRLTAWELGQHGIPHTIIPDNTGGHLMQHGMVDLVLVGSDRTTINGDVANKIGTYLKALAAKDNKIPFYVALPSSSIDWELTNGFDIPIELRSKNEVKYINGLSDKGLESVLISPKESNAVNYAFDITPSSLVTALITERGVCKPNKKEILNLFYEKK